MKDALTNTVVALTRPCFDGVTRLRALADAADAAPPLQEVFHGLVDRLRAGLAAARVERRDADDIVYALVALIDESALAAPALRDAWIQRLLQVHYFGENTAGDGFFRRLADAQGKPDRRHVLVVYHLCLLFGFRGRYALRGESSLHELTAEIGDELYPPGGDPPALAPEGEPRRERSGARGRLPLTAVGAAIFLIALVTFVGLRLRLDALVDGVQRQIAAATAEIGAKGAP